MQKLNNCRSALEAITQAQLAWSADPLELVTANGLAVPEHQAIVRSNTQKVLCQVKAFIKSPIILFGKSVKNPTLAFFHLLNF